MPGVLVHTGCNKRRTNKTLNGGNKRKERLEFKYQSNIKGSGCCLDFIPDSIYINNHQQAGVVA